MSLNSKRKSKRSKRLQKKYPGGVKTLTDQQIQAVKLLCVDGLKVQDAAAVLGVHRTTIWRWKQNKAFWKEWDRQLKAYIHEWRVKSGWYEEKAARRARIRQLERQMKREASLIKQRPTKAFDRAYKEWSDSLFRL